jgi:hypothetical protein
MLNILNPIRNVFVFNNYFSDIKKEISQKFEEPYNSTASPNRSITISCKIYFKQYFVLKKKIVNLNCIDTIGLKEADKPCKNEEIRIQETQGSKRPLPNSFFQMDDYYDQFHKPTVYFPSDQK